MTICTIDFWFELTRGRMCKSQCPTLDRINFKYIFIIIILVSSLACSSH